MKSKDYQNLSGGIMLIGIGLLFLIRGLGFWPWILVVIGAASLPASLAQNKGWIGWQSFFWMVGLAVLFATGHFFPGILIMIGVSALIGGLTRQESGSPFDTKRLVLKETTKEPEAPMEEPFKVDQSLDETNNSASGDSE